MISAEVTKTTVETSFFTPSVIVTLLSTAIASVIIPLTLHFLKAMKEKKDKLYQMRYEAYTQYFKKFESVSSDLGNDYEEFSKVTLPEKFKKLLESDNSPDAIMEFQSAVGSFPHKIQASYQKTTEEITGLQIVCSPEILALTREFESLSREMLEQSSDWLSEMSKNLFKPNFETPIAIEMKKKGERIKELKEEIITQMRKELGTHKK